MNMNVVGQLSRHKQCSVLIQLLQLNAALQSGEYFHHFLYHANMLNDFLQPEASCFTGRKTNLNCRFVFQT